MENREKSKKKLNKKRFPRTKIQWIWDNIEGLRWMLILAMIATVLYNALQLTVPFFSQKIVDKYLTGEDASSAYLNDKKGFYTLIVAMIGITILRAVIVYLDCMAYEHVSQRALYRIRNKLFEKIEHQDMHFYNEYRTGDLMTRLTGDLDAVRHNIAWVIRMIIECFALFTFVSIYFFSMNVKMALYLLAMAPVIFVIVFTFRKKVAPMHQLLREKHSQMNTAAQENISGNRVVKAFSREDYEIDKFDRINREYRDTNKKTRLVWVKFFPFVETCANLLPVVLLWVGGTLLIKDEMTLGEFVGFSGLMWAIANPMRLLGNILNEFQRFSAAADKVMEIYYSEPSIVDPEDAVDHPGRFEGKVEFKHVSFGYTPDRPLMTDVSFEVKKGQKIAIVGPTGAGKTTLINLLMRFYETDGGEIIVDGINTREMTRHELRRHFGMVLQDTWLFEGSIRDNLAYSTERDVSLKEMENAARSVCADTFIRTMPGGYDMKLLKGAENISQGQRQLLTIARAIIADPEIMILDEATSNVDAHTEQAIQDAMAALLKGRTSFVIAHRLSTIRDANVILYMENGDIKEVGDHDTLMKLNGKYAVLYNSQFG